MKIAIAIMLLLCCTTVFDSRADEHNFHPLQPDNAITPKVKAIDVQCALKGAIFGHAWQKHQEGISKTELISDLTIKLSDDGAPIQYINIWIEQMDAALNLDDYYVMVGEIVYQCLEHNGI